MKIQSGCETKRNASGKQGENEPPKQRCYCAKQRQRKTKSVLLVQICFFANQKKKCAARAICFFLLIRSIDLDAIFICPPRLALHDLILFLFTGIINQSFAFIPG